MQSYPTWPNLAAMMFALARGWPDKPMLRAWRDGRWQSITWGEFGRMAASCARHLRAAGVCGGRPRRACMENRPEFPIAETALMAIRAVPVPAYTTNTVDDHAHLLRDSGARVAIVSSPPWPAGAGGRSEGSRPRSARRDGRGTRGEAAAARVMPWHALIQDQRPVDDIAAEAAVIPATALACLIYTSGTGGSPRGVMLPHRCVLSNCAGAFDLVRPLRSQG